MQENMYYMAKDAMQIAHSKFFDQLCVMFTCDSAAFTSLMLALVFNAYFTACSSTTDTLVLRRCSMTWAEVISNYAVQQAVHSKGTRDVSQSLAVVAAAHQTL